MKKIIIIILISLIILAGIWLIFNQTNNNTEPAPVNNNWDSDSGLFFPSGQVDNSQPGALSTGGNLGVGNQSGASSTNSGTGAIGTFSTFNKIYDRPIAGATLIASSTVVFMDKATGHLYAIDQAKQSEPKQISNTTIPKVNHFLAGKIGNKYSIIARYLKDDRVQNFSADLIKTFASSTEFFQLDKAGEEEVAELEGRFLSPSLYQVTTSPSQDRIFYLEKTIDGQTSGYLANWDGSGRSLLFSSPLTEWLVTWPASNAIALQTRASSEVEGALYLIDPSTKRDQLVFSGIPGLSAVVSSSGRKTLYSGNSSQGLAFGVYSLAEGVFDRLPVNTLAEKCTWSRDNVTVFCAVPTSLLTAAWPEAWYGGELSLADNIWKIDTETKQGEIVYNPSIARLGQEIDGTNLFLNQTETTLFLTNKLDQKLWALNLEPGF